MSKKNENRRTEKARKLVVKKETLRTLVNSELTQANGGFIPLKNNCTGRLSGCISQV